MLDATNVPFWKRRSVLVVAACLLLVGLVVGAWHRSESSIRAIRELGSRGQFDSAWSQFAAVRGVLSDCERQAWTGELALMDPRSDSILLRVVDSMREECVFPSESLFLMQAVGNLRILEHARSPDAVARRDLPASAFRAASECIRLDSAKRACHLLGFQALTIMRDSSSRAAWLANALRHLPSDSALRALDASSPMPPPGQDSSTAAQPADSGLSSR